MGMTEFGTSSTKLPLTVNVGKLVSLNGEFAQGGWVIEAFEAS